MSEQPDQEPKVVIGRKARICIHQTSKEAPICGNRNFGDPNWSCPTHGPKSTIDQPDRPYRGKPVA